MKRKMKRKMKKKHEHFRTNINSLSTCIEEYIIAIESFCCIQFMIQNKNMIYLGLTAISVIPATKKSTHFLEVQKNRT